MTIEPDRHSYEQAVASGVRERLASGTIAGLHIRETLLEGNFPDTELVLIFEHDSRHQCLFGFRFPIWSDDVELHRSAYFPAINFIITLREEIEAQDLGLPCECVPDQVTWIPREAS